MMAWMTSTEGWIALFTLTVLEVVLGIDNVVFISILAGRLRIQDRERARKLGLSLAMGLRILLLLSITWVMGLKEPLFAVFSKGLSGRDLILLAGGLFRRFCGLTHGCANGAYAQPGDRMAVDPDPFYRPDRVK